MARDPYQELGVSRTASHDEVRKAFRKLAKENHPDTNPGNHAAEERFKKVSAAFDIVGDVEKRKKFDAGMIDNDGRETAQGFGGGAPWGAGPGPGGFGQRDGRGGFRTETFETQGAPPVVCGLAEWVKGSPVVVNEREKEPVFRSGESKT